MNMNNVAMNAIIERLMIIQSDRIATGLLGIDPRKDGRIVQGTLDFDAGIVFHLLAAADYRSQETEDRTFDQDLRFSYNSVKNNRTAFLGEKFIRTHSRIAAQAEKIKTDLIQFRIAPFVTYIEKLEYGTNIYKLKFRAGQILICKMIEEGTYNKLMKILESSEPDTSDSSRPGDILQIGRDLQNKYYVTQRLYRKK